MGKAFKKIIALAMAAVTAGALGLSAFAGGPMPQEDESAAEISENTDVAAQAAMFEPSLPSGLSVGGVYAIRPMSSPDMTPTCITACNDDSNVTLTNRNVLTAGQSFQLIGSDSGYKLNSLCSLTGKVLDIWRNNGNLEDGCTVDLYADNDDAAQEFFIYGSSFSSCVICLASADKDYTLTENVDLVLTAVGSSLKLKKYTNTDDQKWRFYSRSITYKEEPDPYVQNKTNWCWAASAKMVAEYDAKGLNPKISTKPQMLIDTEGLREEYCVKTTFNGVTRYAVDGAQHAIVKKCHNNDLNTIGSVSDMKTALEYVNPNYENYVSVGEPNSALSPSNQNLFKSKVQEGGYMVAGFGKIKSGKYFGHVVVITDYNSSTGVYTLYDPWRGAPATVTGDDIFTNSTTLAGNPKCRLEYFFYVA